jgi:hypothetical protein
MAASARAVGPRTAAWVGAIALFATAGAGGVVSVDPIATVRAPRQVRETAEITARAGTMHFVVTLEGRFVVTRSHRTTIRGVTDVAHDATRFKVPGPKALGVDGTSEVRVVGPFAYVDIGGVSASNVAPQYSGKNWVQVPAASIDPFSFVSRPLVVLDLLRGAERIRWLDHSAIRGVAVRHLATTISVTRAIARIPEPAERSRARQSITILGRHVRLDAWVDRGGITHRIDVRSRAPVPDSTLRLDLSDFGTAVRVEAPPRAETAALRDDSVPPIIR